jgi:DNA-binding transcriptional MocR family regulator
MALAERAAKEGLWLVPLSTSYFGKAAQQGVVLGFGSTAAEEIPAAVRKLRALLHMR